MQEHVVALEEVLSSSNGERAISRFLKKHPRLLPYALCQQRMNMRIVAEFEFGNEFKADFLIGIPMSGGWFLHFIELEGANVPLFTKKRLPSKHLNAALSQIKSWQHFLDTQRGYAIKQIRDAFIKKDLYLPGREDPEPYCSSGSRLTDEGCYLGFLFHIIIGRSNTLSPEHRTLRNNRSKTDNIDISSYDRLMEHALSFKETL